MIRWRIKGLAGLRGGGGWSGGLTEKRGPGDGEQKSGPSRWCKLRWGRWLYFGLGLRLRLTALHGQRSDSGVPRGGETYSQEWHFSQVKQARSSLNAATTGSKSFLSKFAQPERLPAAVHGFKHFIRTKGCGLKVTL